MRYQREGEPLEHSKQAEQEVTVHICLGIERLLFNSTVLFGVLSSFESF